ncbi:MULTISPECIES: M14 family zinc carboxypeptidase, partial [unclassified Streptomyces]|uniref:M14 family zinc carboxypeptidase n=1 Tax=unclassified Streptomyces TaxID=2593676 RepID=UPI000B88A5A0
MTSAMADAYPSVAGVAAAASAFARFHPRQSALREIGQSREGRPLHLLSYGRGRRNVLVVAGPHSDERIGSATALRLAERVAADPWLHARADATWHFLLCLDPDGTVRSEEGPAVRRTPAEHFRHSYRPPADEQPEWAPSIRPADDQLPESKVLVGLIDELRPFLQCSLHGNDLGGSWIQLTRDLPGLAEPLGKLSAERDVPVQTGTYDALYWTVSGPGVYVMPEPGRPAQFESLPEDVNRSTWIRPHTYGGMTALFEVPMWASRKVTDTDPHPDPARALAGLATLLRHQSGRARTLLELV